MNDIVSWLKGNALWLLLFIGTVFTFTWLFTQRKKLKTAWYSAIAISIIHALYGVLTVKAFAFLESGFSKDGFNGMSIFGAVFMMPLAYLLCAKLFKRNVKTVFDIMTPCMVFTLMCARVNCVINGCCFVAFIPGTDKTRFPTREAEILFYIILLIIICTRIIKEKNDGEIYPLYMICYGAFRFVNGGDGYTYYYNDTVLALGFTKIGNDYYIFNTFSGKMYKDATMWVNDNPYGIKGGMHYFDASGKMFVPDTVNGKKAVINENGKLYFTIDGVKMTNGLNNLDGEYYYANTNGQLAVNQTIWVSQKNDLIPEKGNWYAFDESGKLIKTGFVNGSDGYTYYYNDTVLALGFTKIGGDYYIFNSYSGKMYKDAKMWVGNNDYGIVGGSYYFDSEGRMTTN